MFVGLQIISPILKFREDNLFFKYKKLCTYIKVNFVLLLKRKKYVLILKRKKMYLC